MVQRALVLAGGGVAGIAWELGVLLGIRDGAPDLAPVLPNADLMVGTSAGSTVAAQISTTGDLDLLFDRQLAPESSEIDVDIDLEALMAGFGEAAVGATSPQELLQRIGSLALAAETVDEPARKAAVAGRLLDHDWPVRPLLIPAVEVVTGELRVFSRESGVSLVDAVTASCAVPGVWPPVTIDGHRYMDGGSRSGTNADLARGCDRIVVITPTMEGVVSPMDHLADEIAQLRPAEVFVIYADEDSVAAFGSNPLSPATRRPAALAGRAVGQARAAELAAFWA